MLAASINNTNCRILLTSGLVNQAATVTLSADKKTATIDPTSNLAPSSGFTLRAVGGGTGCKPTGNVFASTSDSTFTTQAVDTTAPTITNRSPASGSTNHSISGNIVITFSEDMQSATITSSTVTLKKGSTTITCSLSESGGVVTMDPSSNLEYSTVYTVSVIGGASGVKDNAGNALASTDPGLSTTAPEPTH